MAGFLTVLAIGFLGGVVAVLAGVGRKDVDDVHSG